MKLPFFTGAHGKDVDLWLRQVTSALNMIKAPDDRKVSLAQRLLRDNAFDWWSLQILDHEVNFEEFSQMLRYEFCPAAVRDARAQEFADAKTENISVAEAVQKFQRDLTYVADTVTTKKQRIHAFSKRMKLEIGQYVAGF